MKSALFPIQTAGSYWAAGVRVRPLGRALGWDLFYRTQRECSHLGPLYCVDVERAIFNSYMASDPILNATSLPARLLSTTLLLAYTIKPPKFEEILVSKRIRGCL